MKIDTNKYTKELENTLKRLSVDIDRTRADNAKKYMSTGLYVHGLGTKEQVELTKTGFSFYTADVEQTFLVYDKLLRHSETFEGKNLAFMFLDKNYKKIPLSLQIKILPTWMKHIDNWAHSDYLSKFLTRLIEAKETQQKMLAHVEKWNRSKNLWERRQSLVALFYYARTKKEHLSYKFVIALIENLLHDKEYFVQKAVGWTLRESYNVYPKETYAFLLQHITSISPYAFTASTEKMSEKEKSVLKEKRKLK